MTSLGKRPPNEPEEMPIVAGKVNTRLPEKWALVDTETGDIWALGKDGGWSRADADLRQSVLSVVETSLMRDER